MSNYQEKYLKYKAKYLALKGGRLLELEDKIALDECKIEDNHHIITYQEDKSDTNKLENFNKSSRKNTRCNNLSRVDNNKFYFYLELETKSNSVYSDLFTNLMVYTNIPQQNIFIIHSNISKQKTYFNTRLNRENLYEFNKNDTTTNIYSGIKEFISNIIKTRIQNKIGNNNKLRNTSIVFDIYTHGNIYSDSFIAIDGNNKYINFNQFYNLFDTAYENDIDIENKSISDIVFIASWCYSSILKNFFRRSLNSLNSTDTDDLKKTKYINYHFMSSIPINNNFLILASYLFSNNQISNLADLSLAINKSAIQKFVVDNLGYIDIDAINMINNFITFHNETNFNQFLKLKRDASKQRNTNIYKEPGDCSNMFFDIYMATNTGSRDFLSIISDIGVSNDKFILLENMDLKLNQINNLYISWIRQYRDRNSIILYDNDNILFRDLNFNNNLGTFLLFEVNIYNNLCFQDIIQPDNDLMKYLSDLFKNSFDTVEFYSNLNYNKLTDKNIKLKHIF